MHRRTAAPGDADMPSIQTVLDHSADAVFGIDQNRRIGYTNPAFQQLMGRTGGDLHGRPCREVLCADDLASRRVCSRDCPIAQEALRRRPMPNFDLVVPLPGGARCWVNVGVYTVPATLSDPDHPQIYFALRRMNGHRLIQRLASELPRPGRRPLDPALTRRELQILELAARGEDTTGIGTALTIAPQTVRNHFKNIFAKLEVRSRAQAVALALQRQLV